MCDYSLTHLKSRPAKVGDKLTTHDFGTGTRGFCGEDPTVAVCVLPGTEIAFDKPLIALATGLFPFKTKALKHDVAIFRQINKDKVASHHDALELPDGSTVLLTLVEEGQTATVLQLPALPKTEQEAEDQRRVVAVG